MKAFVSRLRARLESPVDVASLLAFRTLLGALVAIAVVRHWWKGGIEEAFVAPRYFFPYPGLAWLRPLPGHAMFAVYGAMFALALTVASGAGRTLTRRLAALTLAALFTYAHLADASNYLNHYYLVSLLLLLAGALPIARSGPLDGPRVTARWALWLVRFQVGLVYFFGGVAKLNTDWLVSAMPLRVWLAAASDFPVLGPVLTLPATALAMSWLGAVFDLSAPFLLSSRRTRAYAYAVVCVFHLVTARLFQIGMFPWIMMASSLVFFDPSWPRRLLARVVPARRLSGSEAPPAGRLPASRATLALVAAYVVLQASLPLRHFAYEGDVLWTEEGHRFAWRVMLLEKTGAADFRVRDARSGEEREIRLRDELTPFQIKMMATQPDMLLAYARHVAEVEERRSGHPAQVFADVEVALNGRAPARLVAPEIDLAHLGAGAAFLLPSPRAATSKTSR